MADDKIIYEPHPVAPERKQELREKGYTIIDARFKPVNAQSGKPAEPPQQQAKNEANDPYPNMTDEQLRSAIEKATGTLPHPNTGRKKLVSMLADADKAANTPVQQATNEVTPQGLNQ